MKEFFNRNRSIFVAGLIMLFIFLLIIFVSSTQSHETPEFVQVTQQEGVNTVDEKSFNIFDLVGGNKDEEITTDTANGNGVIGETNAPQGTFDTGVSSKKPANYTEEEQKRFSSEDLTYEEMDARYGIKEIAYSENGFEPRNTKAIKGQLVRWINFSDKDIYIKQLVKKFGALEKPVLVPAGGEFNLRLTDSKLWTYEETETKAFGSIFIVEASYE